MSRHLPKSRTKFDFPTLIVIGCLSTMLFTSLGDSSHVPDTCGDYFFLPMFPDCGLFLEAVPCFNDTPTVVVKLATPAGEEIHRFQVTFGAMTELSLDHLNKGRNEGLIVRSNGDISLYVHKALGDSMNVFPIDAFARDYETHRLTSHREPTKNGSSSSSTGTSGRKDSRNGALYIFSPFNNTSISLMPIMDVIDSTTSSPPSSTTPSSLSSSSPTSSSTTFKLDAFEIHKYYVDPYRRYRLHSKDMFAVVLVQTVDIFVPNDSLCRDVTLSLLDFVPPYSVRGRRFYIAFPNVTDFTMFILGPENTSLDVTTDVMSRELLLDQSGTNISDITRTSSAWVSTSQPVSIYIKVAICSNGSCAENGFFLPSVEHYFSCKGNKSKDGCVCTCPSVFQRDIDPNTFHFFRNATESSRPTSIYPLSVGELFDVSTSILGAVGFKDADDVILTTNNSFAIFRHDLDNLNFLPAGSTLVNIYSLCTSDSYNILFHDCDDMDTPQSKSDESDSNQQDSDYEVSDYNQCSCEFVQDSVAFSVGNEAANTVYGSRRGKTVTYGGGGPITWEEDDEDTTRPLIAVVVSLCVSIFAVVALISGYMLVEMVSRRKHVRNTKIRPFVS